MTGNNDNLLDPGMWAGKIFTGSWTACEGGAYDIMEPATGEVLAQAGMANASDVNAAAARAKQVQSSWKDVAPREKAAIFRRAADILLAHVDELAMWIVRDTGAVMLKGQHEVREGAELLNIAAGMCLETQGAVLPSTAGRLSYAKRVPLGVVGVISPFNFPLILSMRAVAPALAAGNTVLLKPDPQTAISGGYMICEALRQAGQLPGILDRIGAHPLQALLLSLLILFILYVSLSPFIHFLE